MKIIKHWQAILLACTLLPALVLAQPYNNVYTFPTPYQNSVHTDAVQLSTTLDVIEGGTIDDPTVVPPPKVVEIGAVNPPGLMFSPAFIYVDPNGADLKAVDMVESTLMPGWVIEVADYQIPGGLNRIEVFKADPYTGAVAWVMRLGVALNWDLFGAAITKDPAGDYYILGYVRDAAGNMYPYLAKMTDAGVVLWEFIYQDPNPAVSMQSVDLMYQPINNSIVFGTNRFFPVPFRDGIEVMMVDAAAGFVIAASHTPILVGTPDFDVLDATIMPNMDMVFVGRINTVPTQGFLVRYTPPLLTVPAVFSVIYPDPAGIFMTGIQPFAGAAAGNMYVSFEWAGAAGAPIPGMHELLPNGMPAPAIGAVYNQPGGYLGSVGMVPLFGNTAYAVKGAIAFGIPSLSLLADFAPVAPPMPGPPLCHDPYQLVAFNDNFPIVVNAFNLAQNTNRRVNIFVLPVNGNIFDCAGNAIGAFRKAPTGIAEADNDVNINIYPNPTDGQLTIELSREQVDRYTVAEVYNALGEVVATFNVNKTVERLDLSSHTPGIYLLRMKGVDGNTSEAKRIMIK